MILSPTVGNRPRKRFPGRPDLGLHWNPCYRDMHVQVKLGPLITNYLETLYRVMEQARQSNPRLLAVRLDLRYPADMPTSPKHHHNEAITLFLVQLRWGLDQARTKYPHALRYVWCREQNKSDKPHYHLLLILNGDAYRGIGSLRPSASGGYNADNLFHRVVRAWSRAIGWPLTAMQGLVNVAEDALMGRFYVYHFHRNDHATYAKVFYGASYLCKVYSKPLAQRIHCFEGSRC